MLQRFSPRLTFRFAALLAVSLSVSGIVQSQDSTKRGRKYKSPPPTAHFEVTVVRATTGRPIENASVIFHPLVDGHDDGNMELKTNDEGKAVLELLAVGSNVRLQIIAPGFQTYGEDYKVDKDNVAVEVKLKRPVEQYSLYKKGEGKGQGKLSADPTPSNSQDAPKGGTGNTSEPQKTPPDTSSDAPKNPPASQDSAAPKN